MAARTCTKCGTYLGSSSVCSSCGTVRVQGRADPWGRDEPDTPDSRSDRRATNPFRAHEGLVGPDRDRPERDRPERDVPPRAVRPAASRRTSATWTGVRGVVTDGETRRLRSAGGVLPAQLLLVVALVVVVVVKGQRIIELLTEGLVSLVLAFLVPIIIAIVLLVLIGRFLPISGILMVLLQFITLGAARRGGVVQDANGWDVELDTRDGLMPVRIAAALRLVGDEEIVVHGPAFGGVKHAWLVQGIAPVPFIRVARGVIPLLVNAFVVFPVCMVLLVGL